MTGSDHYQRAYEIQKKARQHAEQLLESKSLELYEKNQSLQRAYDQLKEQSDQIISQEKLAAIGQLAAGLAHEINNPNAFVQSNLGTLKEYIEEFQAYMESHHDGEIHKDDELKESLTDALDLISESQDGTKRIQNTVAGMRYFAEPNVTAKIDFDLNECLGKAINLVKSERIKACDIEFDESKLPVVRGVPILLIQALANLIRNAVEASSENGKISISTTVEGDTIKILLTDRGTGIEPENLNKVFEPFYSSKLSANGMGLPIALSIIMQQKGKLKLHSNPNTGTRALITLPIATN